MGHAAQWGGSVQFTSPKMLFEAAFLLERLSPCCLAALSPWNHGPGARVASKLHGRLGATSDEPIRKLSLRRPLFPVSPNRKLLHSPSTPSSHPSRITHIVISFYIPIALHT